MNGIGSIYVEIPAVASLLLEAVKYIVRRYFVMDMDYQFPMNVYYVLLPLCQVLVAPVLLYAGLIQALPEYMSNISSLQDFAKILVSVGIQSLLSVIVYGTGVAPFKREGRNRAAEQELKEAIDNAIEAGETIVASDGPGDI